MLVARLGPENFGCSDFVYLHLAFGRVWLALLDSGHYSGSGSARSKAECL